MTMRPYPCSTMCGHAARVVLNEPRDVHGEVPREIVRVGFGKARPSDDAGVVDQDVDASELLDRRIRRAPGHLSPSRRRCCRRSRLRPRPTISAATVDAGLGVGSDARHRAAEVVDDDARAPLGEQECMGPADTASRTRDDRDAPLEAVLVHP